MIRVIILLWLCLAGGGWGWQSPAIALAHLVIFLALTIAAVCHVNKTRAYLVNPIGWALAAVVLALEMATITTEAWQYGPLRVMLWTAYISTFYLLQDKNPAPWHRAALAALLLYTPLALLLNFDNANTAASNVLFLALLALPAVKNPFYLWPSVFFVLAWFNCMAGLLAAAVAALVTYPGAIIKRPALAALAAPLLLIGYSVSPASYTLRLMFWTDALNTLPFGVGPGNYYLLNGWPHAHNTALNLIAETGFFGLVALGVICGLIVTYRQVTAPRWAMSILAAAAVWCVLDDPWQVLAPSFVMVFALATLHFKEVVNLED